MEGVLQLSLVIQGTATDSYLSPSSISLGYAVVDQYYPRSEL